MSEIGTILASALGSSMATILLNPMLVFKVHMQKSNTIPKNAYPALGTMGIYKQVMKSQGIKGFWAGTSMGLLQAVPSSVTYMTCYEQSKVLMYKNITSTSPLMTLIPGISGSIARFVSVSIISPIELIRTIQASGVNQASTMIARNLYEAQGLSGFYLGWQSTIMRDVPYSGLYWGMYEAFKKRFMAGPVEENNTAIFLSGTCAGVLSAFLTHPFDVVKTKQQVQVASLAKTMEQNRIGGTAIKNNIEDSCYTLASVFQKGGIKALFRGVFMRCAMVVPGSSIFLTVYERVKSYTAKECASN